MVTAIGNLTEATTACSVQEESQKINIVGASGGQPERNTCSKGGQPDCNANFTDFKSRSARKNILKLYREKLILLKCEYDPKLCSYCRKEDTKLKKCAKCCTAKYCSKECQKSDWIVKHKAHCNETIKLKEALQKEGHEAVPFAEVLKKVENVQAIPHDKPWMFPKTKLYSRICLHEGILMGIGDDIVKNTFSLDLYFANTGQKIVECPLRVGAKVLDLCMVKIGPTQCVAIGFGFDDLQYRWLIEFLEYPLRPGDAFYQYHVESYTIGPMCTFDDKLFIVNWKRAVIQEFDTSRRPIKPTGHEIPTEQKMDQPATRLHVCPGKKKGQKLVLMNHHTDKGEVLLCFDYGGQKLWKIDPPPPPCIDFRFRKRRFVCVDDKGHIFEGDFINKRVSLIKEDQRLETLIVTPGRAGCLAWCDVTKKLYIVHFNHDVTRLLFSRYDILVQ